MGWEERARKLEARRRRMRVSGRGLLTVLPQAERKRLERLAKRQGNGRPGRKGPKRA
ncbi:hypothetical protein [Tepidiforma thermophila]|uniref:Uncharacterized protein n=1 Tax=Tepidiforma thermophila (strain KCTC 52669 / CGMCC 1.13589 / G233) TaxID=2761530 RepID=A0A2A9HDK8_TEPT2|nr:hypothetical protein [Tepidiforma thermophila]PFG73232.1 hypothetical protein A9A59_0427 [Tepidiforma thermophila]